MKKSLQTVKVLLFVLFLSVPAYSFGGFFIENRGQVVDWDKKTRNDVLCYGTIRGYTVYVTETGLSFVSVVTDEQHVSDTFSGKLPANRAFEDENRYCRTTRTDLPVPGIKSARHEYKDKESGYFNYYLPQCKDGLTNIPAYGTIDYPELAEGVGMQLSVREDMLVMQLYGENRNSLAQLYGTLSATILEKKLGNCCRVVIGSETEEWDPVKEKEARVQEYYASAIWVSYIGKANDDEISSVEYDANDDIYAGGSSVNPDFPTTEGCFQKTLSGAGDLILVKFSENHNLLWCTFLGGTSGESLIDLDVSPYDNSVWFSGITNSKNFPITPNAFQNQLNGGMYEAYLGNINSNGHLNYLTLYGGPGRESVEDLATNSSGDVFVCGSVDSSGFPVSADAFRDTVSGKTDCFIVKFDRNYNRVYSSYWGGNSQDYIKNIALDKDDNIIISGFTFSPDYILKNEIHQSIDSMELFITKFDKDFNILWSTLFGGSGSEFGFGLAVDDDGSVAAMGMTWSHDFYTTPGAYNKTSTGYCDYFSIKLDKDGKLLWSTFWGGLGMVFEGIIDFEGRIAIDKNHNIIFCKALLDQGLFTSDTAYQRKHQGMLDLYMLILDKAGKYQYSTFLGGWANDYLGGLALNSKNNLLVAARTNSDNLKTTSNAYQKTRNGEADGVFFEFGTISDSCDETGFEYTDFSDDANISYAGKAKNYNAKVRLTESGVNRVGAAWYKYQMPVKNGFSTEFSFRLTGGVNDVQADSSCPGADGLAFVIQNQDGKAIGNIGGRIGYDPIPNSLAVEFDLFDNDGNQIENLGDPNGNHIAVMSKGKEPNSSNHKSGAELGLTSTLPEMKSAAIYYSKIEYNAKEEALKIFLSNNQNSYGNPKLVVKNPDLSKLLDLYEGEWAYVGFTSATGSSYQNHDILSWKFCPKPTDSQQTGVEEESDDYTSDILVYPNPVGDYLYINPGEGRSNIMIYNIMGREVKSLTAEGSTRVDVSGLPCGYYFVAAISANGAFRTQGFLKN